MNTINLSLSSLILVTMGLLSITPSVATDGARTLISKRIVEWEAVSLVSQEGLKDYESTSVNTESLCKNASSPTLLKVFLVKESKSGELWSAVQRNPFVRPRVMLVGERPWAVEAALRNQGIRVLRMRKVSVAEKSDLATIESRLKQVYRTHDLGEHMFINLPFSEILPEEYRYQSKLAIDPVDPVQLAEIKFNGKEAQIGIRYWFSSVNLLFTSDWELKQVAFSGKPIEFNREAWTRAYAVWKKALEKEIAETEK